MFLSLVFTFNANAECDEQGYFDCGTTGDVKWYVSNDKKTLTVKGTGNMEDYVNEPNPNYDETNSLSAEARTTAPWGIFSNDIESVIVEKGVTGLGRSCFQGLDHVTDIKLPDGLQTIGQQAFDRVKSLESLSVPDSVNQIGYAAFAWTTSLKTMDVGDGFEGHEAAVGCAVVKLSLDIVGDILPCNFRALFFDAFLFLSRLACSLACCGLLGGLGVIIVLAQVGVVGGHLCLRRNVAGKQCYQ